MIETQQSLREGGREGNLYYMKVKHTLSPFPKKIIAAATSCTAKKKRTSLPSHPPHFSRHTHCALFRFNFFVRFKNKPTSDKSKAMIIKVIVPVMISGGKAIVLPTSPKGKIRAMPTMRLINSRSKAQPPNKVQREYRHLSLPLRFATGKQCRV